MAVAEFVRIAFASAFAAARSCASDANWSSYVGRQTYCFDFSEILNLNV